MIPDSVHSPVPRYRRIKFGQNRMNIKYQLKTVGKLEKKNPIWAFKSILFITNWFEWGEAADFPTFRKWANEY